MNTENAPTLAEVVESQLQAMDLQVTPIAGGETMPEAADYKTRHRIAIGWLKRDVEALPAITDEKSFEVNDSARKRLAKVRTGLETARKAITDPFTKLKKHVDTYLGTTADSGLQGEIKAMERTVEARLKAWTDEQARKAQERAEARGKRLMAEGMAWDGARYSIGAIVIWPADVQTMSDDAFEAFVTHTLAPAAATERARKAAEEEQARRDAEAEEERRKAKEAQRAEEVAAMEREFERQRKERERLDAERAALDAERAAMRKEKMESRMRDLVMLGAANVPSPDGDQMQAGKVAILCDSLADLKDDQYAELRTRIRDAAAEVVRQRQEDEKAQARWKERATALFEIGAERDDAGTWTLGDATTTDHVLRTATADEYSSVQLAFKVAQEQRANQAQIASAPEALDQHTIIQVDAVMGVEEAAAMNVVSAGELLGNFASDVEQLRNEAQMKADVLSNPTAKEAFRRAAIELGPIIRDLVHASKTA
mgnify:CR=1 FL=1